MRKLILSSALLTLLTFAAAAQNKQDDELIAVVKKAAAAQENYDPPTLEKVYASDYIEISPRGEIDVREKAIGFYRVDDLEKARSATPKYILDEFNVRRYGKFAIVISRFSLGSRTDAEKPPARVGLVVYALRREKDEWKIYSAQFTPFPLPARPPAK